MVTLVPGRPANWSDLVLVSPDLVHLVASASFPSLVWSVRLVEFGCSALHDRSFDTVCISALLVMFRMLVGLVGWFMKSASRLANLGPGFAP